ncbi:MAG TPA: hypothetical protein VJV79_02370 [Polyangiaceae bacterium]|nr:hypothetical protein [Polyangiaceae bacterium]
MSIRNMDDESVVLCELVAYVRRNGFFPRRDEFFAAQRARWKAFDSLETKRLILQLFGRTVWTVAGLKAIGKNTPFATDELGRGREALLAMQDLYVEFGSAEHPLGEVQKILGWRQPDEVRRALVLLSHFPAFHKFSVWLDGVDEVVGMQEHVLRVDPNEFSVEERRDAGNDNPRHKLERPPGESGGTPIDLRPANSRHDARAVDIGIITIREDEFEAALDAFPMEDGNALHIGRSTRRHYNIRQAESGTADSYRIAIVRQTEQGTGEAQALARDLIEDLSPLLILVVGIAGAPPSSDLTLGDVVVSTHVHDYTVHAKIGGETVYALSGGPIAAAITRGIANLPARKLDLGSWWADLPPRPDVDVDDPGLYSGDDAWKAKIRKSLERHFRAKPREFPIFVSGVLGSSDGLLKDPAPLIEWLKTARNLRAVEMEAAGVYRAAGTRSAMLAIRGISDIVGFSRDEEWTQYACRSAASFARAYLRTTPVAPGVVDSTSPTVEVSTVRGPHAPSAKASEGGDLNEGFLPCVGSLRGDNGMLVLPLLWQLRFEPPEPFTGTKSELLAALTSSVVEYDLQNYSRTARWPRVLWLPEATASKLADGSQVWSHAYSSGARNECGDEQFFAARSGTVGFQRASFWDNETIALDFGTLGFDTLLFLTFLSKLMPSLSLRSSKVTLSVRTPKTDPPTVAHFNCPPLEPEVHNSSELSIASLRTTRDVSLSMLENKNELAALCKRLLDGIANEFSLRPSALSRQNTTFMSIKLDSVIGLHKRLLDPDCRMIDTWRRVNTERTAPTWACRFAPAPLSANRANTGRERPGTRRR